ncbi:MBL fold metallo-hydrolase [Flammeovirga aprica]|uniref:MBL fold metallo-hydrolase n=1 Tax=Flammeovirga aprica JL-4 TaxID=694437 RepID=A0A7X9NZN9_9BACT|nr:MBL fold metallo-hydrolase [Flammeovirga aprica]NME66635.1 MBL fold metallo-hydrolase [Flammeovirga aprica JL-4]
MLKKFLLFIFSIICIIIVIGFGFLTFSPQFGGTHSEADIHRYEKSGHYKEGEFFNLVDTNLDMSLSNLWATLKEFAEGVQNGRPTKDIPPIKITAEDIIKKDTLTKVTWFGHSAFLLEIDNKNILVDPMFGQVAAPHPWLGEARYSKHLPLEIEEMPDIDVVIISHDHYDHLDYESIEKLKDKVSAFFVPLGVGAHFRAWDVPESKIHEMNWWDTQSFKDLQFVFTPSRHFSGRGLSDRNKTLWGSWIVKGRHENIYFSGDGGYADHFKEIGQKYGPFDLAFMECGQYNDKWAAIHMMPEESAQGAVDLNAKVMMPVHWGAFTLALHSWTDPVVRVTKAAKSLGMPITTPQIGETFVVNDSVSYPAHRWWEAY